MGNMINTNELLKRFDKGGYSMGFVAFQIGCTIEELCQKIYNQKQFLSSEVERICSMLNLTINEIDYIFFPDYVKPGIMQ